MTDTTGTARKRRQRERERERARLAATQAALAEPIRFVRADWAAFLDPRRLPEKAGVPIDELRAVALKEAVDNALDATAHLPDGAVRLRREPDGVTWAVEDDGPGFAPEQIVELFSVTRPMVTSKLLRRPTRGALGNGLRVVTGAVFGSGGALTVETRGRRLELDVDRGTGVTFVRLNGPASHETTRLLLRFGDALPATDRDGRWAEEAIRFAGAAAARPTTHPSWYDEVAFSELQRAVDGGTARALAKEFGVDLADDRPAPVLCLAELQALAGPEPELIPVGEDRLEPTGIGACALLKARARIGGAEVPVLVEVAAVPLRQERRERAEIAVELAVNRTPNASRLQGRYLDGCVALFGCGLQHTLCRRPSVIGDYNVRIALTCPAVPLLSDGKSPDLSPYLEPLGDALGAALGRAAIRLRRPRGDRSIKEAAYEVMPDAYLQASAGGTLPANARQIMYAARPAILARAGADRLNDEYFTQTLLPSYLEDFPDATRHWDVVFDARGHLVEPHTGLSLPLGTLQVRDYLRPRTGFARAELQVAQSGVDHELADRFRTVLFVEKEGFNPLLAASRVAECHDCAVMSTKGMSVTAARALIESLSGQGVRILVLHDFDLSGFSIFGTLAAGSWRYRYEEEPDVVDLGLRLEDVERMGLEHEPVVLDIRDHREKSDLLRRHGANDAEIAFLLSGRRVELNAMPSDQLLRWLEGKLARFGRGKVIPSDTVLEHAARHAMVAARLRRETEALRRRIEAETVVPASDLRSHVAARLANRPELSWQEAVAEVVTG